MTERRRDKAPFDLDAFFAAARAETPAPDLTLMNAILADAADVAAERARAAKAATPRNGARERAGAAPAGPSLGGFLRALGGWRGASALALCAALGFGAGMSGRVGLAATYLWSDSTDYADPGTDVTAIYDLALAEG